MVGECVCCIAYEMFVLWQHNTRVKWWWSSARLTVLTVQPNIISLLLPHMFLTHRHITQTHKRMIRATTTNTLGRTRNPKQILAATRDAFPQSHSTTERRTTNHEIFILHIYILLKFNSSIGLFQTFVVLFAENGRSCRRFRAICLHFYKQMSFAPESICATYRPADRQRKHQIATAERRWTSRHKKPTRETHSEEPSSTLYTIIHEMPMYDILYAFGIIGQKPHNCTGAQILCYLGVCVCGVPSVWASVNCASPMRNICNEWKETICM